MNRVERIEALRDARRHLLALFEDLDAEQHLGPHLEIVNPPLWEVGHVAWFTERWVLRELRGRAPLQAGVDEVYDSIEVHHPERWHLVLPDADTMLDYFERVAAAVEEELTQADEDDRELAYFARLARDHTDMHVEAMLYTRQTLGYGPPAFVPEQAVRASAGEPGGDVELGGGPVLLGADPAAGRFVFDNEKWAHEVVLAPFRIARHAVTQSDFLAFLDADGYRRRELWSDEGWRWRSEQGVELPAYWQMDESGRWYRRRFDRWVPLEPDLPMLHVSWHEAEAYCRFAGRRLPTEAEWEAFAAHGTGGARRGLPWGAERAEAADPVHANTDFRAGGCLPVDALPDGDSHLGGRQLIGNVWEWTASTFEPYPGFVVDPYKEYSVPWFGTRKVLRGGSWASRLRMLRNTWRNYFTPDRRDVWSGFRTCSLEDA